jgi:hypothetical protein
LAGLLRKGRTKIMRKKDWPRKTEKILIRITSQEKDYAFSAARAEGKEASPFIRDLLNKYKEGKTEELSLKIPKKYEKLFKKYKLTMDTLIETIKKVRG